MVVSISNSLVFVPSRNHRHFLLLVFFLFSLFFMCIGILRAYVSV